MVYTQNESGFCPCLKDIFMFGEEPSLDKMDVVLLIVVQKLILDQSRMSSYHVCLLPFVNLVPSITTSLLSWSAA